MRLMISYGCWRSNGGWGVYLEMLDDTISGFGVAIVKPSLARFGRSSTGFYDAVYYSKEFNGL